MSEFEKACSESRLRARGHYTDPGDQNVEPPPKDSTDPAQGGLFEIPTDAKSLNEVVVPMKMVSVDELIEEFGPPDSLPYQRHSETSREAAEAAKPTASTYRRQVLDYLRIRVIPCGADRLPGATDEEMQDDLQLNPSTQRPRRVELVSAGLVRDSGRKRKTKSGRWAVVWEAV